jgi:taurine dioxygenase
MMSASTHHAKVNSSEAITCDALTSGLGAEIRGVDVSQPLPDAAFSKVLDVLHDRCVIVFRGQKLAPQQLAAFSARFGELDVHHMIEHTLPDLPTVRVLSNVVKDGRAIGIARGGMHWHSDLSYKEKPALGTLLYGIECPPEGADTLFANMYAAYDSLPPQTREKLHGLRAVHDRNYRYRELYPNRPPLTPQQIAKVPPVEHPVVRVHPVTRRRALFIAKDIVSRVVGMDVDEGRRLVEELEQFATRPAFVYAHKWRAGDLVVWDNRCLLHRATPYDNRYHRTLWRTQVKGDAPIAA